MLVMQPVKRSAYPASLEQLERIKPMNEKQADIIIYLLRKIVRRLETPRTPKQSSTPKAKDDQRIALAVVAIARGASSYQEIADELGVSRCTVSRNPGIRRAMQAAVRDRSVCSEAAEEFKFQKGR
jgi:hypothetical protein